MRARAIEHTTADDEVVRALASHLPHALAGATVTPAANGAIRTFALHRAEPRDALAPADRDLPASAAYGSARSPQSFSRQSRINDQPIAQNGRSSRSS